MMSESSKYKVLKSGIWYVIANFLVRGIGFLTTPVFTRILTKAEFGHFNNYLSWLAILTVLITLNLDATFISARVDYKETLDQYILSMFSLSAVSVIIWTIVINVFKEYIYSFSHIEQVYMNIMMAYLFFLPAINLFIAKERFRYGYKKLTALSVGLATSTAVLSIVLVLLCRDKLFGRIIGFTAPTVFIGFFICAFFLNKGKTIRIEYWKYALPISLPYIPHLLSLTLLNSSDRTMIMHFCTAEDTAVYGLAYTCGSLITLLVTSMNSAMAPWIGEKLASDEVNAIKHFSKIYIVAFFLMAIGVMLVSPEILLILGGEKYANAKYIMTPIAMGCVCQFLYTMFVNVEQFKKKTKGMAVASIIAAGLNIMLNYIFIPRYGYFAAAYTTLVGYVVLLLIHMYLVYRIKLSNVYDYVFIYMTVVAGILFTIIITMLYSVNHMRYLIIAFYGIALLFLLFRFRGAIVQKINRR